MNQLTFAQTLERLGRDDTMRSLHLFVLGACHQEELRMRRFSALDSHGFYDWTVRIEGQVWKHLDRNATIDASYGDFEADLCHRAYALFGRPVAPVGPEPAQDRTRDGIDAINALSDTFVRSMSDDDYMDSFWKCLDANAIVTAVKLIRKRLGCGLYEAKALMEYARDGKTSMRIETGVMREYALMLRKHRHRDAGSQSLNVYAFANLTQGYTDWYYNAEDRDGSLSSMSSDDVIVFAFEALSDDDVATINEKVEAYAIGRGWIQANPEPEPEPAPQPIRVYCIAINRAGSSRFGFVDWSRDTVNVLPEDYDHNRDVATLFSMEFAPGTDDDTINREVREQAVSYDYVNEMGGA